MAVSSDVVFILQYIDLHSWHNYSICIKVSTVKVRNKLYEAQNVWLFCRSLVLIAHDSIKVTKRIIVHNEYALLW